MQSPAGYTSTSAGVVVPDDDSGCPEPDRWCEQQINDDAAIRGAADSSDDDIIGDEPGAEEGVVSQRLSADLSD